MSEPFNQKRFDFLMVVQTTLINNAINRSLDEDAVEHRANFSATGTMIDMDDALFAADRIPTDMTAYEAAHSFLSFKLEKRAGNNVHLPSWFARG